MTPRAVGELRELLIGEDDSAADDGLGLGAATPHALPRACPGHRRTGPQVGCVAVGCLRNRRRQEAQPRRAPQDVYPLAGDSGPSPTVLQIFYRVHHDE